MRGQLSVQVKTKWKRRTPRGSGLGKGLTREFDNCTPDHLPAAVEEGKRMCVEDPQNFLVLLGLEERGLISKRAAGKGPFPAHMSQRPEA